MRLKSFIFRNIGTVVLACVLLSFGTSCRRSEALGPVRIGTMGDAVDYAPYMVARSKGWFEEEFRKNGAAGAEYTAFQSLPTLNETLATNRLDLVFEAEPPAIVGKGAAGVDLRVIGISCSLTQEIVVRADSSNQNRGRSSRQKGNGAGRDQFTLQPARHTGRGGPIGFRPANH